MTTPDLVKCLVSAMATEPHLVGVRLHETSTRDTLIIQVSATDMPRVLGRRASVFTAIRSLVDASTHPDGREYRCCQKLIQDPDTVQSDLPDGRGDQHELDQRSIDHLADLVDGVLCILLGAGAFETDMTQSNGIVFVSVRADVIRFRKVRHIIDSIFGAVSLGIRKSIIIDEG